MSSDITVILTLFNTPEKSIRRLVQYKKYKLIIFNQASDLNDKKRLKKILKIDYKYFFSSKNLGLSKSSNFLLSKVKTKYCLFTQPDIIISNSAITKGFGLGKKRGPFGTGRLEEIARSVEEQSFFGKGKCST